MWRVVLFIENMLHLKIVKHLTSSSSFSVLCCTDVAGNIGINAQLSGLASRHTDLESRIRAIQERTESQQKRMTQVYSASMMTRTKVRQN